MAFMNMEQYVKMCRVEKHIDPVDSASISLASIQVSPSDTYFFTSYMGGGLKMDWTPVAVETQKVHVNWRQSINDDGTSLSRLASFPLSEEEAGNDLVGAAMNDDVVDAYIKNKQDMDSKSSGNLSDWISAGPAFVDQEEESAKTRYKNDMEDVTLATKNTQIDPMAIIALAEAKNTKDYIGLVQDFSMIQNTIGSQNPALIISAMGIGTEIVKSYINGTLEQKIAAAKAAQNSGSGAGH